MGALAGATAILASSLGTAVAVAQDPVEIEWWHIDTNDPGLSLRQEVADEYMAENPNVKINITVLENEAFKQKLALDMQAGSAPDIFNSWGGGVLAEQAEAGSQQPGHHDQCQPVPGGQGQDGPRDAGVSEEPGHARRRGDVGGRLRRE